MLDESQVNVNEPAQDGAPGRLTPEREQEIRQALEDHRDCAIMNCALSWQGDMADLLAALAAAEAAYQEAYQTGYEHGAEAGYEKCAEDREDDEEALAVERATSQRLSFAGADALSHLISAGMHSSPMSYREDVTAARQALEREANDTIHSLIVNARHLEWIVEIVASSQDRNAPAARTVLDRFRAGCEALSAEPSPPVGARDEVTPCHICGVPIAMICDDCLAASMREVQGQLPPAEARGLSVNPSTEGV